MPSWPIHIAVAKRLNKSLDLSDDFILGNILPDVPNGYIIPNVNLKKNKRFTHFHINKPNTKPIIGIDSFLNIYQGKLDNPIVLGYYVHLLTDKFFNDDFHRNHVRNNKTILNTGVVNDTDLMGWELKQMDFNIFGDFLTLNGYLGDRISLTRDTYCLTRGLPFSIPDDDLNLTIDKINSLISNKPRKLLDYSVYTEEELITTFDNCYEYILKIIEPKLNE